MRVFISSVIGGMEEYRDAAADAIRVLRHTAIRAEDFGASPAAPRIACLNAMRSSDAVVLILGSRYGDTQESGLSATHEEYREARDTRPVLVMVQKGVDFEPRQQEFRDEVQDWQSGQYTQFFNSSFELKDAVIGALHDLSISRATSSVDSDELLDLALENLEEEEGYSSSPRLAVAMTSGPIQNVVRPAELESSDLKQSLIKTALFGPHPIFTHELGTNSQIDSETLMLGQDGRNIWIQEDGTIDLLADMTRDTNGLNAIIEEDVKELIEAFIGFAVDVLDQIDDTHRLSHSVVVANLLHVRNIAWRTRQEHASNPNTITIPWGRMSSSNVEPVHLTPYDKPRSALLPSASEIAEDLTVLLRRQIAD